MTAPEYAFDEMIELIRNAEGAQELQKLNDIIARDGKKYCLFHLELLDYAITLQIRYDVRGDVAFLKKMFGL